MAGVQNQDGTDSNKPSSSNISVDKINSSLEKFELSDDKKITKKNKGAVRKKVPSGLCSKSKDKNSSAKPSPCLSGRKHSEEKLSGQDLASSKCNRLSASDPSGSVLHLKRSTSGDPIRAPKNSSSSSQSSETARITAAYKRGRRNSDSCPERGHLVQCALRVQHAAHKCSWSGSESTSVSPAYSSSHQSADDMLSLKGASGGPLSSSSSNLKKRPGSKTSSSSSRKGGSRASKQDLKFESYMPLCEVQQGLKKGELIEGVLRINPRNYEDAYISAPDGQMDIFIGGIRDRNRALNGDVVVVQLKPPEDWKILHDAFQNYQRSAGNISESSASALDLHVPSSNGNLELSNVENTASDPWGDISGERPPDTLEILGLEELNEQFKEFCKEAKKNNKKKKRKGKRFESTLTVNNDLNDWTDSVTSNSSGNIDIVKSNNTSVKICSPLSSASEVLPSITFDREYNESIISITKSECDVSTGCKAPERSECPVSNTLEQNTINDSISKNSISHTLSKSKSDNSWTTGIGSCSDNLVVSPEDLLTFEDNGSIFLMQTYPDDTGETSSDRDKNYSTDEGGIVVAPEDLSEDEFSDSLSGESTCSHNLDQLLEDAAFYASQQDAKNNNMDFSSTTNEFNFSTNVHIIHEELNSDTESLAADESLANCNNVSVSFEKEVANVHLSQDDHPELNSNLSCLIASSSSQKILSYASHVPANLSSVENDKMLSTPTTDMCDNYSVLETHNSKISLYDNCTLESLDSEQSNSNHNNEQKLNSTKDDKGIDEGKPLQRPSRKKKRSKKKKNSAPRDADFLCSKFTAHPSDFQSLSIEDIMNYSQWQKFVQKTGKVVYILEKKHTRVAAGIIKILKDKNKNMALFSPTDHRLPRVLVPMTTCPQGFYDRPSDYAKTLFIAHIIDWEQSSLFAKGTLVKNLGDKGEIEPETEGILLENSVDFSEFPDNVLNTLQFKEDWKPSPEEIARRRDFRSHCVFTIDPSTARDLDDALSCQFLDNECLEVGVHIADVTYFVQNNSPLDIIAQQRATSVYLVQKVIPMLPRVLCDQLCSLNPGEDRLTFSVVWHLNKEGDIINEWFGHSVIRSCMKMSYEHTQDMIENPTKDWTEFSFPPIYGNFTLSEIAKSVMQLHQLAVNLRSKRFQDGALRLDQIKLHFALDSQTGLPSGFSVHEQKDSHRLVEEFMLLANRSVAHRIFKAFPNEAFLRCHPPPHQKMMEDLVTLCAALGVHLDVSSSGALQESLNRFSGQDSCSQAKALVLTALCSKPMNRAVYYCSASVDEKERHHYALNVPLYTHFTSPIRRYPDIVVHRLLAASLGYSAPPTLSSPELKKLATHCNDKKWTSKKVQELSSELFLAVFIKECGPIEEMAVVMGVMDRAFDVLILRMGVIKRIYCDKLPSAKLEFQHDYVSNLTLIWQTTKGEVRRNIGIFTMVEVILEAVPDEPLKYNVVLKNPYEDVNIE